MTRRKMRKRTMRRMRMMRPRMTKMLLIQAKLSNLRLQLLRNKMKRKRMMILKMTGKITWTRLLRILSRSLRLKTCQVLKMKTSHRMTKKRRKKTKMAKLRRKL